MFTNLIRKLCSEIKLKLNFRILKQTLHATHFLKLLDKMCEMDPTSIVEDTERTRFCPQTGRRTDGETDKVKPVYPTFNFVEAEGIKKNDAKPNHRSFN